MLSFKRRADVVEMHYDEETDEISAHAYDTLAEAAHRAVNEFGPFATLIALMAISNDIHAGFPTAKRKQDLH
jgi:hypothetical protein